MTEYPPIFFRCFKWMMGLYLTVTYGFLLAEVRVFLPPYNTQAMMIPPFMPVGFLLRSPMAQTLITLLLILGISLGLGFAFFKDHRPWALGSFFVWSQVLAMHPLFYFPQDGYVGWFLLATLLIPALCPEWKMPEKIWKLAWVVIGVSYFASFVTKLETASWKEGQTVGLALHALYARHTFLTDALGSLPELTLKFLTWGVLALEASLLPLSLFEKGRQIAWWLLLFLHLGFLFFIDITSITCAFLVIQVFLVRSSWLSVRKGTHET